MSGLYDKPTEGIYGVRPQRLTGSAIYHINRHQVSTGLVPLPPSSGLAQHRLPLHVVRNS